MFILTTGHERRLCDEVSCAKDTVDYEGSIARGVWIFRVCHTPFIWLESRYPVQSGHLFGAVSLLGAVIQSNRVTRP